MTSLPAYEQALIFYRTARYHDCLGACERILAEHPEDAETQHLIGMLCFMARDSSAALSWFEKALASRPDWAEAHSNRGLALKTMGRVEESLVASRRALELDPEDSQAHSNFGVTLRSLGHTEEAVDAFRRSVELNPMVSGGFTGLGLALAELGQTDEALAALRKAVAAFPHLEGPYLNLAAEARRQGRLEEATEALRWGVAMHGLASLGRDLAQVLDENGQPEDARSVLTQLADKHPSADAFEALGNLQFRRHAFGPAKDSLLRAVSLDPFRAEAHMRLYTVGQILGERDLALDHQGKALAITRLFTEHGPDTTQPHLLILKAAGDWQANLPTDFIINPADFGAVHHYYIDPDQLPRLGELPPVDAVFSAVAEPDLTKAELAAATTITAMLGVPVLNEPSDVARTGRADIAALLAGLPGMVVPPAFRLARQEAAARIRALVAEGKLALPILLRPVGTHAGNDLEKIERVEEVADIAARLPGAELYATQFVDTRDGQGLYTKYRVVVVDGRPYPFHLGLSRRWMVHYYNADPGDPTAMDRAEERFLRHFEDIFPPAARTAFAIMHERLGLDFFGVDCALDAQGALVLFEVDVGVIIHLMDDRDRYAYKHETVPRIFDAVREMIRARVGR